MKAIIGIDPGASGGIAVYYPDTKKLKVFVMPKDVDSISDILMEFEKPTVYMERVALRPSDMDEPGKIYRMQRMVKQAAIIEGILSGQKATVKMVAPRAWQRELFPQGLPKTYHERKRIIRDEVRKRLNGKHGVYFVGSNGINLKNADAVALVIYAWKTEQYV